MPLTDHQLRLRQNHLGASEMPIILGMSPYSMTPRDIYWRKVCDIADEPTEAMQRGHWLEDALIDWAAGQLGVSVIRNQLRVLKSGDGAGVFSATHDALVRGDRAGIEAKVVGRWNPDYDAWGDEGTDQIPPSVVLQCQQQILVSGLDLVWVPVAIEAHGGLDRRIYTIPRDDELIEMFRAPALAWWRKYVVARVVPDGDPTPPMEVLKRLRRDPGVVVDLDRGVAELIDSLDEVKVEAKDADARKQALQARIIDALLDAEAGRLPDGRMVTYREQRSSPKVDTQALKLRHPDLYAEIVSQGTHRTLRVVKPKNQQKEN